MRRWKWSEFPSFLYIVFIVFDSVMDLVLTGMRRIG